MMYNKHDSKKQRGNSNGLAMVQIFRAILVMIKIEPTKRQKMNLTKLNTVQNTKMYTLGSTPPPALIVTMKMTSTTVATTTL